MSGPKQLYCGTCLKLKDGVCASWGEATEPGSPACAEYEGANKTVSEPTEQINENRSLKGFGVSEEMPEGTSTTVFNLYAIPGLQEAIERAAELLYQNIQEEKADTRVRKLIVTIKIDPDTMKIDPAVSLETPKPKPIKLECRPVFGVKENGTIRIESAKQEPLFPKG